MTPKETDRARRTHVLKTAEGGTCQDIKGNQLNEVHPPTGDGRGRNLSGHAKKPTDHGTLTSWRQQREGYFRTQKETDRARRTHSLETTEGGTCQDTERNRLGQVHSLAGDSRGRDLSGHRKKPTKQGTLTTWRQRREGRVRT